MTLLVSNGKICTDEIAKLSVKQLKFFLALHAMAPHPEARGFASDLLAAIRKELQSRG